MVGVLRNFDFPLEQYADDIRDIVNVTVSRFGTEEWERVLLTNEIHGHLGIYSTLGAKMGLRARELFGNPGHDTPLTILSYAGEKPPVSCLNDGIQISTGATLGHGLIRIAVVDEARPEARFSCNGRSLTLRLKAGYARQISEDIKEGVERFGHTPDYWLYVRSLAIRYWSEWDRREIFETTDKP